MGKWTDFAQQTRIFELRFEIKLKRVLYLHYKFFTDNLRKHGPSAALSNLQLQPWNEELTPLLKQLYTQAGLSGARRAYYELRDEARTARKFTGLGRNETWIRDVLDYIGANLLNKAVIPISETTRRHIMQVMETAVKEGWGVEQIVQQIMSPDLLRARARTIARTEVMRASNVGHSIGARSHPFEVVKKWVSAPDHRTRHSHKLMNGKAVDETEAFTVPVFRGKKRIGTDKMQFPCDPAGSKENTINCRCRSVYVAKRDAQGRIIPRKTTPPTAAAQQFVPFTPSPVSASNSIATISAALTGLSLGALLAEALND